MTTLVEIPYFLQVPSQAVEGESIPHPSVAYIQPDAVDVVMPLAKADPAGNQSVILLGTGTTVLASDFAEDVAAKISGDAIVTKTE